MAEADFDKEELLSTGDLLKDRLREVNEARDELNKAVNKLDDLVEKKFVKPREILCITRDQLYLMLCVSSPLDLYFRMLQTGRHLSNGEVVALAKRYKIASEPTVQRYLKMLYVFGLIRRDESGKYLAIPPSQLVPSDIV